MMTGDVDLSKGGMLDEKLWNGEDEDRKWATVPIAAGWQLACMQSWMCRKDDKEDDKDGDSLSG